MPSHPLTPPATALPAAVRANDLVAAADLLRAGADPNRKDPLGYPPLALAAALGHVQMVELLLTAGADPLLLDTRMGASALHKAAQSGAVDAARLLLAHGAFIDQQAPTHGHTPLIDAAWHKRAAMARFLLEQGANPLIRAHGGYTARDVARSGFVPGREAAEEAPEIVAAIDEHLRRRQEREADGLRTAALRGDAEGVRRALAGGADVNAKAPDGHTPLLDAAREGHAEVVAILLAAGADPRVVDHLMKATPAHKAGYMGHAAVMRLLVEHGGLELDAQGPYNGYTALHDAVWHGHTETVRVLLEAGARTDLRGLDGRTPLEMAREYGYAEIAALLAAREA